MSPSFSVPPAQQRGGVGGEVIATSDVTHTNVERRRNRDHSSITLTRHTKYEFSLYVLGRLPDLVSRAALLGHICREHEGGGGNGRGGG